MTDNPAAQPPVEEPGKLPPGPPNIAKPRPAVQPPSPEFKAAGNTSIGLYGKYQQYVPLPPGYHVNDYAVTGNPEDLPNWDKLTRAERTVYFALPGISEAGIPRLLRAPMFPGTYLSGETIPTVGAAMAKFGESWLGKILGKIDIPAEGLERGLGYVAQAALAIGTPESWKDFTENSKAAWFAGSLTADVTNMPLWDHDNKRWYFPGDMGDLPGRSKLIEVRGQIADLIQQGMDPGDALVIARDTYYESLGALQLRAQINDGLLHMAADPLVVMPFLKPVEAAKKGLVILTGEKIVDSELLAKFATQVPELQQYVELSREISKRAGQIGDTIKAESAAADAARFERELLVVEAGMKRAQALKMGPWEERFVRWLGLDSEAGPSGIARIWANPFALTPGSRARAYMGTLLDNITAMVFNRLDDPAAIERTIVKANNGLYTPELGHHMLTIEGRMVRANLGPMAKMATERLAEFEALQRFETPLLNRLAIELGQTPWEVLKRLDDGEDVILAEKLTEIIRAAEPTDPLLQAFVRKNLPIDEQGIAAAIERLKPIAKDDLPLITADAFKSQLAMDLTDVVGRTAVTKWGLKSRGPIMALADAIKAAETLAFLKMNPTYPIRNALNNFLTSVARGVFGDLRPGYYEDLFQRVDETGSVIRNLIEPTRFRAGVGYAGLGEGEKGVGEALASFNKLVADVERGKHGSIDKLTDWLSSKKGLYMGAAAQDLEVRASVRAYGTMWTSYMKQGWKPGAGFSSVTEFNPELARLLGPEKSRQAEQILRSSWSALEIDTGLLAENANANIANIMDIARRQSGLGESLDNILGPAWTQQFGEQLQQAILKGPDEVKRETGRIWNFIQSHIEDQSAITNSTMLEEAAARVSAEGVGAFPYILGDGMKDLWAAQTRHAIDMAKIGDWVKGVDDPLMRGRFWDRLFKDNQAFYKRHWDRIESRFKGAGRGLDDAMDQMRLNGTLTPELKRNLTNMQVELRRTSSNWRKNWDDFFNRRTELYTELKGLRGKERARAWTKIKGELDDLYEKAILKEDELMVKMDIIAGNGLPETERAMFLAHRNRIAETRMTLRQSVINFRRETENLTVEARATLYEQKYWPEQQRISALLEKQEDAIKIALEGDPEAQLFMGLSLDEAKELTEAKTKLLNAEQLTPDEADLVSRIAQRHPMTPDKKRLRTAFGELSDPVNLERVLDNGKAELRPTQDINRVVSSIAMDEAGNIKTPEEAVANIMGEVDPNSIVSPEYQRGILQPYVTETDKAKLIQFEEADAAAGRVLRSETNVSGSTPGDLAAIGEGPEVQVAWSEYQQAVLRRDDLIANASAPQPQEMAGIEQLRRSVGGTGAGEAATEFVEIEGQRVGIVFRGGDSLTITGKSTVADNSGAFRITRTENGWLVSDPALGTVTDGPYDSLDDLLDFYVDDAERARAISKLSKPVLDPGQEEQALNTARRFATAEERKLLDEAELAKVLPGSLSESDIIGAPLVDMPPQVRDQVQWIARAMVDEAKEGFGGGALYDDAGKFIKRTSSNPPWYVRLYDKYKMGKPSVTGALDKIIAGEGDTGVWVERMKAIILDELVSGPRGLPPDPEVLRILGRPQAEIKAAVDAWKEIPGFVAGEVQTEAARRAYQAKITILNRIEERLVESGGVITPNVFPEQIQAANLAIDTADAMRKIALGDESAVRQVTIAAALKELGNPGKLAEQKLKRLVQTRKIYQKAAEAAYPNLREAIFNWAQVDGERGKKFLIQMIEQNPKEAAAIQDAAQWWLREQGFDSINLRGGKLSIYRTGRAGLEDLELRPYDSFTSSLAEARMQAGLANNPIIELEIPVDNIFSHHHVDPGFSPFKNEREFLLNEKGVDGATVVSINGRPATPEQVAMLLEKNPKLRPPGSDFPGLLDFHAQSGVPREMMMGQGIDELWFNRGQQAMDAIESAALQVASEPAFKLDIPQEAKNLFAGYIENTKSELGSQHNLANKMGEWGRDSALLNYNRRMRYNNYLGVVAPYEFWMTNSLYRWALHSIDRPQMIAAFYRWRKFLETAYRPEQGLPARLKGHIRIKVPFLPDFLGDEIFIDPMRAALPIDQFGFGIESFEQQQASDAGRAERVLNELLNDGKITREQYAHALLEKDGPDWDRAVNLARQDDSEGRNDAFDFVNMFVSMHAPMNWAYNLMRGESNRIGPFLPITRSIRSTTSALGLAPNTGGWNPEAMIRKGLGLPAFDQWDDYRVDRMLANMAATNEYGINEALRAMIERRGDMYLEAVRRAGIEYAGGEGLFPALGRIIGMPFKSYPPGEEHLRKLKDNYEEAWQSYEDTGDNTKLNNFNDLHPEYEGRLALWKTPEQRLRSFVVDEIWSLYNEMPKLHKDELKVHLGDLWQDAFLNKDTRSVENVPTETLQAWLKIMGGDPPGKVTYNADVTPLNFAPEDDAYRVQVFYDTRDRMFQYNDYVYPLMDAYFKLDQGEARKDYLRQYPLLGQYWNWRTDFMERNPDVAKYIEDDPSKRPTYENLTQLRSATAAQPNFTPMEWEATLGRSTYNLTLDLVEDGEALPMVARDRLDDYAHSIGLDDWRDVIEKFAASHGIKLSGTPQVAVPEPSYTR